MNSLLLLTICALVAAPIYAEESQAAEKKVEKRGVLGLGYGGYAGYGGYLGGYNGIGNGYVAAAAPAYAAAPYPVVSSAYVAPVATVATGYVAPAIQAPAPAIRVGYAGYNAGYNTGYNGIGLGHNLGYVHG